MSNNTFSNKRTRTKTKRYSPTHDDNGYLHPKGNKGNSHYYRGEMGPLNYFGKIVRLDINDNENNEETDNTPYDNEFIVDDSESNYETDNSDSDYSEDSESENSDYSNYSDSESENSDYSNYSNYSESENSDYSNYSESESDSESEDKEIQRLTQLASDIIKEMDYDMWEDWTNNNE